MKPCALCSPGSIPEEDGGKLYNTCTVFGPDGDLLLKHRKVWFACTRHAVTSHTSSTQSLTLCVFPVKIHLFDIDVPGKIRFQESEMLSPGNSLSMFETREPCLLSAAFVPSSWTSIVLICLCVLPQPSVR